MSYIEVSVIVDGAQDETAEFGFHGTLLEDFLLRWAMRAAEYPDCRIEIFLLHHDHDVTAECECVQFLQDHHPHVTFNAVDPLFVDDTACEAMQWLEATEQRLILNDEPWSVVMAAFGS